MSPFDYIKIINNKSEIPKSFEGYSQFIINRHFSYFPDTCFISMETATRKMTDQQHFLFLYNIIPKANRFAKWEKAAKYQGIDLIKEVYGYSDKLAHEVLELFTEDDLDKLRKRTQTGGRIK